MNLKNMMKRLTYNYEKTPGSNIHKLFSIISEEIKELRTTFSLIQEWRSIEHAKGSTLDQIGDLLQEPRGNSTDEQYRIRLRFKISKKKSTADINSIINSLSNALKVSKSEIHLYEKDEPASYHISFVPYMLQKSNMKLEEFFALVKSVTAAGVRVIFELEFSDQNVIFSSAFLSSETDEIYPYQLQLLELSSVKLTIPIGANTGVEEGTVFPLVFRLDSSLKMDNGFHFDEHA